MCTISEGFKLCSCSSKEELGDIFWVLERHDTSIVPQYSVMGMPLFPEYNRSERKMIAMVLNELNTRNCFDFSYTARERDVITLNLKEEEYRFVFRHRKWILDESTAFDGWREQMVPYTKGTVQ